MECPGVLLCAPTRIYALIATDHTDSLLAAMVLSFIARFWYSQAARLCIEGARACVQVAKALQYLHEANPQLLHRDLKSENLLLTERGRTGDIRVMDFGLTKLRSAWPPPLGGAFANAPACSLPYTVPCVP